MTECTAVSVPRNVFARLPSYNPFVGTFHHAPSAGNRGAVYFSGDIVGMSELEERKKFRHHPLTGTFHSLPGYYDPLHCLSQFRNHDEEYPPCSLSHCDTDSVRSFVAVDLSDTESMEAAGFTMGQPQSLSRMYSDSTFRGSGAAGDVSRRPRRFSDSDAEAIFVVHPPPPTVMSAKVTTGIPVESREKRAKYPLVVSASDSNLLNAIEEPEKDEEPSAKASPKETARPSFQPLTSRPRGASTPSQNRKDSTRSSFDKRRKSSSGSTESDGSSTSQVDVPFHRHSVTSTELNDGFISTGKGIFRKIGVRPSSHDRSSWEKDHRNNKPGSPARSPGTNSSAPGGPHDDPEQDCAGEYTQAAPRIPLNPFVARRLTDGEEIRIMAVHRHSAPRERFPHVITTGSDTDDDLSSAPKPYFIHEKAVTEQYELCGADQLGDGSYAVVKPAIRRANGKEVAIKQIHKRYLTTDASRAAVEREIEIHLRLKHRHIVRLYEVYETVDFLYLVMAKAKKGNLKQLMQRQRRLPEALAGKLAQQIVRAVLFLHESGVLHCDLKPENILLTDAKSTNQDSNDSNSPTGNRRGSVNSNPLDPHADVKVRDFQVELCDFGLSVKVPDVRFYKLTGDVHKVPFTGVTGTPGYIAPELLQQQSYGKPVDMWSVGIVIYEMLTGYQPFWPAHACINETADFNDRVWKSISEEAKDLTKGLLASDPAKRLTAADALSHGWFDTATFAI